MLSFIPREGKKLASRSIWPIDETFIGTFIPDQSEHKRNAKSRASPFGTV